MNNITPVEFLATAFYYKKDVEKIVLTDTPSVYADIFKSCLYNEGFEIRDFHYSIVSEAISNLLNITTDVEEITNMSVCILEDQGYIEADCYTHDLIEWSRDADAIEYINEALQDFGPFTQYTDLLMSAQYSHKRALYELAFNAVQSFLSQVETGEVTTN